MRRIFLCAGQLALTSGLVWGQDAVFRSDGPATLEDLRAEIAQLTRVIADQERRIEDLEKNPVTSLSGIAGPGRGRGVNTADQERRIAQLERTVRELQAALAPVPKRIPSPAPMWLTPVNWGFIKPSMSEKQVTDLIGAATRVTSVVDVRILYYGPDPKSASPLHGSVTLKDDRVIALEPPDF